VLHAEVLDLPGIKLIISFRSEILFELSASPRRVAASGILFLRSLMVLDEIG
jgi:hypothetical protein